MDSCLIPVRGAGFAVVDPEDYERLARFAWFAATGGYAARNVKKRKRSMHREVLGVEHGVQVDHIDGDKLNNRRSNLRPCTNQQNCFNQAGRPGTSRFKGVFWNRKSRKWQAGIRKDYRARHLGMFENEMDAAAAYDRAARELFGDFARLNLPEAVRNG